MTRTVAFSLRASLFISFLLVPSAYSAAERPNIITVFIDDMGWSDLSCFGGDRVQTENIDGLAREGLRFTNFYVNSPICSPSRVALSTGQYPQRWRISSYLAARKLNASRGMAQWLDPQAPVLARQLQAAGYATGHFGKWHLGGQRDVGEAPLITEYGFDRSLTNFEGLGPRVLPLKDAYDGKPARRHDLGSANLGRGPIRWEDRSLVTATFVNAAVEFIDQAQVDGKPFFVNLWPDDVHSPFFPPEVLRDQTDESKRALYYAVLDAMDQQLGRLFDRIRQDTKLRDETLILVMSDNGHEAGAGSSAPLRGAKTWLYEGGVRSPLIVWGPGVMDDQAAGTTDKTSIICAMDVNRSLYSLTRTALPDRVSLDGEDLASTLLGKAPHGRVAPIFWRRPPDRPGTKQNDNPDLAVRQDKWKYYANYDGSGRQLYDLKADVSETNNVRDTHPGVANRLHERLIRWNASMPVDAGDPGWSGHTAADSLTAKTSATRSGEAVRMAPGHRDGRPNILLILADDLGYSDLGCYGGEIPTPNIDALAAEGVRFTQVYNSARCCPSRASLMTGLYPSQAGIGDFTTNRPSPTRGPGYLGRLNDRCATIAEVLKPVGYGCYYVGKWHMHPETGPIQRGFDEFYGYTRGHSHDQYDADYYIRLPAGRAKEIDPPDATYYATDVFNEYALEFVRQGQQTGQPWFLFLGHSSPHFPVQAPADRIDKFQATYLRGWDVLRQERYQRMQKLGLIDGQHWKLTPRSIVPVDRDDIANGFPGEDNPAWDSLETDRQLDLARRMAVFAAMVEGVDKGVGQIVKHLKNTDDLDNTLILFLSDNGACYEWGPFGFDGNSRKGTTTLRTGDDLRTIGGRGTHQSYGSAWANLGNTPFRLYKHFTHEGGISTPFVAHWPKGIGTQHKWVREPAHLMDVMPTLIEVAQAEYPANLNGHVITPMEGTSLLPAMRGEKLAERSIGFDHQTAHALRQGDWKLVWSKRMPHPLKWELYHLAEDRCELNDLADKHPERVNAMVAEWEAWARHVQVDWDDQSTNLPEMKSRQIAQPPITISGHVHDKTAKKALVDIKAEH